MTIADPLGFADRLVDLPCPLERPAAREYHLDAGVQPLRLNERHKR